jgi:hypothetical protein
MKGEGTLRRRCRHRPVQYLNNILEQDHRAIKRRVKAKQGFRAFQAARRTIAGYEAMHMMRKGHRPGGSATRMFASRISLSTSCSISRPETSPPGFVRGVLCPRSQSCNTSSVAVSKLSGAFAAVMLFAVTLTVHANAQTSALPSWNDGPRRRAAIPTEAVTTMARPLVSSAGEVIHRRAQYCPKSDRTRAIRPRWRHAEGVEPISRHQRQRGDPRRDRECETGCDRCKVIFLVPIRANGRADMRRRDTKIVTAVAFIQGM